MAQINYKEYTQGNWYTENIRFSLAVNCRQKHIAMVNYSQSSDPDKNITLKEHNANTRLIAAAPEMYELLEEIYEYLSEQKHEPTGFKLDIEQLMAKVQGLQYDT